MSIDPSPPAVTAHLRAPEGATVRIGTEVVADSLSERNRRGTAVLDDPTWCRWWRELIVERYRIERLNTFLPLPNAGCPWELRVALGRVVEASMAFISGPSLTTQLVIEALEVAGFGRVRDLTPDARRMAMIRSGWGNDPWPGDDDLRLGVLGSVADALVREVPPAPESVDLRTGPATDDAASLVATTVVEATRDAVFAYARHIELQARRSRDVVRSYRF